MSKTSTTERIIRITAKDDASTNILAIARAFGNLRTIINQTRLATTQLLMMQSAEQISVTALTQKYVLLRYAKLLALGLGLGGAVLGLAATAAMFAAGSGPVPVSAVQTSPGTTRNVSASGLAVIHAGETISRETGGSGGRSGAGVNIVIHNAQMSYRAGIEETAENLGTLIYQGYRRLRH
jgi:hypothetical protein